MGSPFLGAWLMTGAFLADKLGPASWRLYWITVAVLLIRGGVILWRRLQLSRMAAGFFVGAGMFGAFGLLGGSQREVNALFDQNWLWLVMAAVAAMLLIYWEGRHSPEKLRFLHTYSRTARLRDRLIFKNVPDLRSQDPA